MENYGYCTEFSAESVLKPCSIAPIQSIVDTVRMMNSDSNIYKGICMSCVTWERHVLPHKVMIDRGQNSYIDHIYKGAAKLGRGYIRV